MASALLSAIHVLTLALGLGAVFIRGRALARPLDDPGWQRLLAADTAWGVAAAYRRINAAEIVLVVAIVFAAAFMARGAWIF